jgi:hypothetical protein
MFRIPLLLSKERHWRSSMAYLPILKCAFPACFCPLIDLQPRLVLGLYPLFKNILCVLQFVQLGKQLPFHDNRKCLYF